MPGKVAAMNPVLANIEDVVIDDNGRYKYILCKVYIDDNKDDCKMIIRGTVQGEYHADIFDMLEASLEGLGVICECLGGGKIDHDMEAKNITVFGISQTEMEKRPYVCLHSGFTHQRSSRGFGKADHSIAVKLLKEKYTYYNCITQMDHF